MTAQFWAGFVIGALIVCTLALAALYMMVQEQGEAQEEGRPVQRVINSPTLFRRMPEKRKPKVQDDLSAWMKEQERS